MRFKDFFQPLIILLFLTPFGSRAEAQFQELGRWLPETTNSVVLVRVGDILSSEIGRQERWRIDRRRAFESGMTYFPPGTSHLILGSQIDFEFMEPIWQTAVFEYSRPNLDIVKVSKTIGANIEMIAGQQAVRLPNDAFLVLVDDRTMFTVVPANRQMTYRRIRSRRTTANLSPYLMEAVNMADQDSHILIAMDFDGAANLPGIKNSLKTAKLFGDNDLDLVSDSLASIRGVKFGVTIKDTVTGAIKVDFEKNVSQLAGLAKPVLILALEKYGMMIDDIEQWPVELNENQISLRGPLSAAGLRQVSSLIEQPLLEDIIGDSGEVELDMKTRSLHHFRSVAQLVDELRGRNARGLDTHARWFDSYAREIGRMSVRNVDPVVLDYGRFVADRFRDIASGLLDTKLNRNTSRRGGIRARQRAGGQARLSGANQAREIMREIDQKTAEVRQQMSVKYGIDF